MFSHPRHSPWATFLLIAFGLHLSLTSSWAATGPTLVKERRPQLYAAWVALAGEANAQAYFADWTESEIHFLDGKLRAIAEVTDPKHPSVPSADTLFDRYSSAIFGSAGEVYGNVYMKRLAQQRGALFIDEDVYLEHNPDGNKPDGVLFRIEDNSIRILSIFESKLGNSSWSSSQIEGFLHRWSNKGMRIPTPNGVVHFKPSQISMEVDGKKRPIEEVKAEDIKKSAVLVGTKVSSTFPGTYVQMPVDATTIREVAQHYLTLLRNNRPQPRGSADAPAPVLKKQELENFQEVLRDFILERKTWPKSSMGPLAAELRRHMSRRGGQARTFIYDLDGATRHFIARNGDMPPLSPLEQHLLEASPEDPRVVSALRAYFHHYEKNETGPESPFASRLIHNSPDWKFFFSKHTLQELRQEDPLEAQGCAEHLSRIQK